MKSLFLASLFFIPFFTNCQIIDTAMLNIKVDSLILLNQDFVKQRQYDKAYEVIRYANQLCLAANIEVSPLRGQVLF